MKRIEKIFDTIRTRLEKVQRCATTTAIVLSLIVLLSTATPGVAASTTIRIYFAGPQNSFYRALTLTDEFEFVTDPWQADVFVFNGEISEFSDFQTILKQGTPILLVMGEEVDASQLERLFGLPVEIEEKEEPLSLVPDQGISVEWVAQIAWSSAPQVRERYLPQGLEITPLVIGFEQDDLILGRTQALNSTVTIFTPGLDEANSQIQEWAYFNYFIYSLVVQAVQQAPVSFGQYPYSPVPHARDRIFLFTTLAVILLAASFAYLLVRRYSRAHPEALDTFVTLPEQFKDREAGTEWEEIGFHRPLGGFLLALMVGIVFFIPLIIYQNLVLPVLILPSAQAIGIWGRVTQFFTMAWNFFDMGTGLAFIKFFSQYRVKDPRRAIQYGQVFVWWQALSGAIQVALVTVAAGSILPETPYALYAWAVISHALIQIPGFFLVMRHSLYGLQRFDYAQSIDMAAYLLIPMITQPAVVLLAIAWGKNHPVMGPAMSGVVGLMLAAYVGEALAFLLGFWLYRRLGLNARLLFMAHFDWDVIKEAFRFGIFEMGGSISHGIAQALEIVITQTRLVNYSEIWGNWILAQNFVVAFGVLYNLYDSIMPAISEAISNARLILSQYYSAIAYKYGGMVSGFIGAVLLAVADRFILGASGVEFERAALYVIPLTIWGAIQFPSWVGDIVQLGSNKPYLKFAMMAAEQTTRILLAFLLVARFQINGLIAAYFIALLTKGISAYFINDRYCYKQKFYRWQSLAAPLLAAGLHFAVLRWLTGLIWKGDEITSVLIFLIGILPSFPLYMVFYGLAGGWDHGTLEELKKAVPLAGFTRPLAQLVYISTSFGARLSPLHNRFPIAIQEKAQEEAASLTQEKVKLT